MNNSLRRRDFLKIAATAPLALQSLGLVQAVEAKMRLPLITIFLSGGASAKETFNPDSPSTTAELRGPLSSIPTRTTGIHFSELFPKLADRSDRFALLRGLDSGNSDHVQSQETAMLSGNHTISEIIGDRTAKTVPYVLLNPGSSWPGLRDAFQISSSYGPLWDPVQKKFVAPSSGEVQQDISDSVEYDEEGNEFKPPTPTPSSPGPSPRLAQRRALLRGLDTSPPRSPAMERMERLQNLAFDLSLGGGDFFEAVTLPENDRERYGKTLAGDMTLLAKRFIERGAGAVTVYHEPDPSAWDAHKDIDAVYKRLAPEIDQAAATLIDDITQHRLQCVLLLMGEFNRTPRINISAGRDHWQLGNCAILSGGRVKGGIVHGKTNPHGQIIHDAVPQSNVLGNTVMVATGIEIEPTAQRIREVLT